MTKKATKKLIEFKYIKFNKFDFKFNQIKINQIQNFSPISEFNFNSKNNLLIKLLISIIVSSIVLFVFNNFLFSLMAGLICFVSFILLEKYLPLLREKKRIELIEKELPFALMQISIEINLQAKFEIIIKRIADANYGLLSKEFALIYNEINSGKDIRQALFNASEKTKSLAFKKSLSQLIQCYASNSKNNSDNLKKIAIELFSKQKTIAKEFSNKLVLISLVFITVSAIIPAFFQAFIVLGSMFLNLSFSPMQALLIPILLFPALDLIILIVIKSKTPECLKA